MDVPPCAYPRVANSSLRENHGEDHARAVPTHELRDGLELEMSRRRMDGEGVKTRLKGRRDVLGATGQ